MAESRRVRLFRNGRNQAVRIPVEFELPGNEATLRREGASLVLEPLGRPTLLAVLDALEPIPDEFPDIDEGLAPIRDIKF